MKIIDLGLIFQGHRVKLHSMILPLTFINWKMELSLVLYKSSIFMEMYCMGVYLTSMGRGVGRQGGVRALMDFVPGW